MEVIEALSGDHMIAAWVDAERDSPRYRGEFEAMGIGSVPLSAGVRRKLLTTDAGFQTRSSSPV